MASKKCTHSSREAELARRAAGQHGLVTRKQAEAAGMSTHTITARVQSGEWVRVLPGVYRLTAVAPSGRQAAHAAALWAGPGAVVSHAAAGVLWELMGVATKRVELWVPPTCRPTSKLVTVHRGVVEARDRRVLDGIPVTSPARTVVDLAGRLDGEALDSVVDDAVHRRLVSPAELRERAAALAGKGRAGTGALLRLLTARDAGPAAESRLETRVRRVLRAAGLRPVPQHEVVVGARRYRLDFAWPAERVAVEADGWSAHGARRAFERDRRRSADLAAAGWRVLPVTWTQISQQPADVIARVRAALEMRATA